MYIVYCFPFFLFRHPCLYSLYMIYKCKINLYRSVLLINFFIWRLFKNTMLDIYFSQHTCTHLVKYFNIQTSYVELNQTEITLCYKENISALIDLHKTKIRNQFHILIVITVKKYTVQKCPTNTEQERNSRCEHIFLCHISFVTNTFPSVCGWGVNISLYSFFPLFFYFEFFQRNIC